MMLNPILFAIPLFFVTMLGEYWLSKRQGRNLYRLNDTIANLSCGVTNQLVSVLLTGTMVALYTWAFDRFHFLSFTVDSIGVWILGFILVDFTYYWWHRASHRIHFLWAIHSVHHQSEEYNLSVALRQAAFSPPSSLLFNLPLALLGLPPQVFFICSALNTLYQYWIHTELIDSLGPLEAVINTPSHHRVHHGINLEYLDKNYAGVFIIWDRLFGTFEPEGAMPVYGLVTPLRSWNVLTANLGPWAEMFRRALNWSGRARFLALLAGPEYSPQGPKLPAPGIPQQSKYDFQPENRRYTQLFWFLVWMLLTAFGFLIIAPELDSTFKITGAGIVFLMIIALNRSLEKKA